jgi:hypothetical protein
LVVGILLVLGIGCRNEMAEPKARAANVEVNAEPSVAEPSVAEPSVVALEAEANPEPPDPADEAEIEESEPLDPEEVSKEVGKLKERKKGKALHADLDKRGFKPGKDKNKDFYGQRTKIKHPDKPNTRITQTFIVQNYHKQGSSDAVAIGSLTVSSKGPGEDESTTYDFALIAADGDFENVTELTVDEMDKVVVANSMYSCVRNYLIKRCTSVCATAAITCTGTWVAYLACVGVACGGCVTVGVTCCGCDCSWWCRWGVGCCDR